MNFIIGRLKDYALKRLQEPTTWIGIITIVAGQLHWNVSPEVQAQLAQIGVTVGGLLLILSRSPANTPENPTLPTVIRGALPAQPLKPIVPPADTAGMQPVGPKDRLAVDASGVVHDAVSPDSSTGVGHALPVQPPHKPIRPDLDP